MSNCSTTAGVDQVAPNRPGERLTEDVTKGYEIAQNKPAVSIGAQPRRINEIAYGTREVTADTAFWLALHSGTSEELRAGLKSSVGRRCKRRPLRDQRESIAPLRSA